MLSGKQMGDKARTPFPKEIRQAFESADLVSGLPDAVLSCLLFAAFFGAVFQFPNTEAIYEYVQFWFVWEILAVASLPSIVWIFEKGGEADPRSINVPRWLRVVLPLIFLLFFSEFQIDRLQKILSHLVPLVLLKSSIF